MTTKMRRKIFVGCVCLAAATWASWQRPNPRRSLIVRNATLFDGTSAPPRTGIVIRVQDGLVEVVGDQASTTSAPAGSSESVTTIDAAGRFVIPGLIDLHQHAVGVSAPPAAWLREGVTSVRDPGAADLVAGRRLQADLESGRVVGPRLFLGLLVDLDADQSEETVRRRIAEEHALGVDLVKLYIRTPAAHARAAIEEAHARDLPVTWHLSMPLSEALALGVDGVEHLYIFRELLPAYADAAPLTTGDAFKTIYARWAALDPFRADGRSFFDRLARSGAVWTPTLVLSERIARGETEVSAGWTPDDRRRAQEGFDAACRMVGEAHARGARIGAGTDTEHPSDLSRELVLLVRCGLKPAEAILAATQIAAAALWRERTLGTIEVGKQADMVILGGDPMRDIGAVRQIWRVIKAGRVFKAN